jgi:drug/metabolite transporter (DMT)-like permease
MTGVWLPLSLVAGLLQIIRNAAQRGLADDAGPWGATLVRFLFGLPFTLVFLAAVSAIVPPAAPVFDAGFFAAAFIGALAQVLATVALIQSMRASSFGLGSTFQHVSLPLAAVFGFLVLGDVVSGLGWAGIWLATLGLLVASWPKGQGFAALWGGLGPFRAGLFGLASGACFAVSGNAFRWCGVHLAPEAVFWSSTMTLVTVQAMQSLGLGVILAIWDRRALRALRADLRASLTAGLAGAAASACWFAALSLASAALVRAINALIEAPGATVVGWLRFGEKPDPRRSLGAGLIVGGVVLLVLLG